MRLFGQRLNNIMPIANYICPICREKLTVSSRSYQCKNNHCFDQAKEGYVNLLPVQHKHSKDPGDNKSMVQARRSFLAKGFYQPLLDHVKNLYQKHSDSRSLLDAGCGEGFYTSQHKTSNNQVYGVDIAKETIKIAAKKHKDCHFSVGTLSNLPFEDGYFNWIYSIYAPILENEFTRVLQDNGYLLTVTPAANHLIELKSMIYRDAKEHDINKTPIENLTLLSEERLNYKMEFTDGNDVVNLTAMTPFAFKASESLMAELAIMETFSCQADFLIRLYQKTK